MILILSFIPNQKISNNLFLKKAKFYRQTLHGSNDGSIKWKMKQCTKYRKYIRLENRRRKPNVVTMLSKRHPTLQPLLEAATETCWVK